MLKRTKRVRAKILSASRRTGRPRLSVFRSNQRIYAQIIDDVKGVTLVSSSGQSAQAVGENIARKAKGKKIAKVIFDRGCYHYHGRVKALAEAARQHGLQF